jgi:hypothetical protein
VFSASAFHWADPEASWQRAADVLVPGGTLALVQYFGMEEARTRQDQDAALAAIAAVAPDIAASWPAYRDLDATLAGIERRRGNISRAWSWLGSYDIGREYAGRLFGDVQAAVMPKLIEHTPGEAGALAHDVVLRPALTRLASPDREYEDHRDRHRYAPHDRDFATAAAPRRLRPCERRGDQAPDQKTLDDHVITAADPFPTTSTKRAQGRAGLRGFSFVHPTPRISVSL